MPSSESSISDSMTSSRKNAGASTGDGADVVDGGSRSTKSVSIAPSIIQTPPRRPPVVSVTPGPSRLTNANTTVGYIHKSNTATVTSTTKSTTASSGRKTIIINGGSVDEVSKKVGFIVDEFKCQHNNFSGILYCGPLGIVFLGRFLLFEWTVSIKWEDVLHVVQKQNRKGDDVDIQIETRNNNLASPIGKLPAGVGSSSTTNSGLQVYQFEQFFDARKALNTLASLHNDSILDVKTTPTPRMVSRGLRRMNSDPLRISNLFNFEDMPSFRENEYTDAATTMRDYCTTDGGTQMSASKTRMSDPATSIPASSKKQYHLSATYGYTDQVGEGRKLGFEESNECGQTGVASPTEDGREKSFDAKAEWTLFLTEVEKMKELVVQDYQLVGYDMEQFLTDFVDDNAPHSILRFMKENGEDEVTASSWTDNDGRFTSQVTDPLMKKSVIASNDPSSKIRTIEYIHPNNIPMAPPTAGARKEQTLKQYGQYGLAIETKTFVSDVPMTDCFYLCDVIRVQPMDASDDSIDDKENDPKSTNASSNGIVINVHCDIRFVKSTMFQSLITKTAKSEFKSFAESMIDFIARNAQNDRVSEGSKEATGNEKESTQRRSSIRPVPPETTSSGTMTTTLVIPGMLALVVILQVGIFLSMRQTKSDIRELMAAVAAIQNEHQNVCTSGE